MNAEQIKRSEELQQAVSVVETYYRLKSNLDRASKAYMKLGNKQTAHDLQHAEGEFINFASKTDTLISTLDKLIMVVENAD